MTDQDATLPVVVAGAGAAGLMAAIFAAAGPRPVLLLEASRRPAQKILISGGGRCNVLPSVAEAGDYVTAGSPNTLRKILSAWPLDDVRRFFERDLDVPLRLEPESGKLFPAANRARTVLDALLGRALASGVKLRVSARVAHLAFGDSHWRVTLDGGETIRAARVILATGGLSVPATGSDGAGLRLARSLGHSLIPTYPALVPLTGDRAEHHALSGLSLPVTLSAPVLGSQRQIHSHGGFLFTHRGYSGPAVLNISHVVTRSATLGGPRTPVWVQWSSLDAQTWDGLLRGARGPLLALLRHQLPDRLAVQLVEEAGLAGATLAQLTREQRATLVELLAHYPLPCTGSEGYRTAEVTGGGVPLNEINAVTLESRVVPGLYLCGEILDAFGPIGGYNFLWAWITGRAAGLAAAAP